MKVNLLYYTPLSIMVKAIRVSHNSFNMSDSNLNENTDNIGDKDKRLLKKVFVKMQHGSVGEHINYTFEVNGLPRYVLQELARHRIGVSMTVKSTRYTLGKEIKNDDINLYNTSIDNDLYQLSKKYLEDIKKISEEKKLKPDQIKKVIPENYTTDLIVTINLRALYHLFKLRINPAALDDFQMFGRLLKETLPRKHLFIFEEDI